MTEVVNCGNDLTPSSPQTKKYESFCSGFHTMDKEIIAGSKQFCMTRPTNLYIRAHLAFYYLYQSHSKPNPLFCSTLLYPTRQQMFVNYIKSRCKPRPRHTYIQNLPLKQNKKKQTIKRADIFRLETGQDRKQKLHSKETKFKSTAALFWTKVKLKTLFFK